MAMMKKKKKGMKSAEEMRDAGSDKEKGESMTGSLKKKKGKSKKKGK